MQVLLLSHLLCLTSLVHSQAGLSELPGIAAWRAAIQQHAQAERKVVPKKEGDVPGLASWEAHQRAVLEAEKRLEQSGELGTLGEEGRKEAHQRAIKAAERKLEEKGKQNKMENNKEKEKEKANTRTSSSQGKPGVAEGFKDIIKSSINKLLSKLSGKNADKGSAGKQLQSKVEALLERSRETKIKEQPIEESFLDKLIKTYSNEERENALRSVGNDEDITQQYKRKYSRNNKIDRQRALRQKKYRDRFSFLYDYDYELPLRRKTSQRSSFRVLTGDYLDLISDYDDYDYEDDLLGDVFDYNERAGDYLQGGITAAARESQLLDRQLKKLLRNI